MGQEDINEQAAIMIQSTYSPVTPIIYFLVLINESKHVGVGQLNLIAFDDGVPMSI